MPVSRSFIPNKIDEEQVSPQQTRLDPSQLEKIN